MNGIVRYFRDKHGYIKPDGELEEIFVHHSDVPPGFVLKAGDRVSFEIGSRHRRNIAVNLQLVKAAPKLEHVPAPPKRDWVADYVEYAASFNPIVPEKFGSAETMVAFRPQHADRFFKDR
jgi:cold shock CspA family protein